MPVLYDEAFKYMRESSVELLKTWQQSFVTCSEENDASDHQYLEVGCGPGNITRNDLLPLCPPSLTRLVGTDISEAMLDYARNVNAHPKVHYRRLDITADEDVSRFIAEEGRFQRVYSFFALHCIQDKAAALRNIERLMTPGGECLIIYHPYAQSAKYYRALLESGLWEKYHGVLWRTMPVFHETDDPVFLRKSFLDLVKLTGIVPLSCELLQVNVKNVDLDVISRSFAKISPIYDLLTEEEKPLSFKFTEKFLLQGRCSGFSTTGSTQQH
ncbi:hypothetical protein HPB52_015773 [Rhipicephalus sanguineus]|uniref:Methyltransferase type 12 domain-containing protein n=1 Tax=Rhipicephalus sanguineus TaxID=34632 RepID=A0A9D4T3X3_RHISA|nr:hypothetical protein HPB52_015773 [Rhipicephalus sanguineus]